MNKLLLIASLFIFSSFTYASYDSDAITVRSKNYTCSELQDLVEEQGVVNIRYLGSLSVYAHARDCVRNIKLPHQEYTVFKSTWKTIDKRFCVAGYSCRATGTSR